jgi:prolyl oligopeptidase
VVDTYHGVAVADPYRWLENAADPEVGAWTRSQAAYARNVLDALPERDAIQQQVQRLANGVTSVAFGHLAFRPGELFAMRHEPGQSKAALVVMPSASQPDKARTFLDPAMLDRSGRTSIDWYVPSHDGRVVAVSLSQGGSENGDLQLFDVATGLPKADAIAHVEGGTAGGDLAWLPDDTGFFYTRYPRPGERAKEDEGFYVQVYLHRLGDDPAKDTYVFGRDAPRIAEYRLFMDAPSGRLLITVQDGDSNRFAHWLRAADGAITRISGFADNLIELAFGSEGKLYGVSWAQDGRGEIVVLPAGAPTIVQEMRLVAPGQAALGHSFYNPGSPTLLPTRDRLFAVYQNGGPSEVRAFTLDGKPAEAPVQDPVSAITGLIDAGPDGVLLNAVSYVEPPRWFAFDPASHATRELTLTPREDAQARDLVVERITALSKDGAQIPVNIIHRKDARRDGAGPIIVTGYGGFGLGRSPTYDRMRQLFFDNGIVWAEANLRGGNEYGDAWHRAGMLTNKQQVFDDFAAVIETLVAEKYAARNRVAILGGSNGGLLVGALATERPELAAAVVARSGIFDSLRNERDTNGAFNVVELGSVQEADQFAALRAYSPYHNVKRGATYPAFLMLTSGNDPRVNPMHSRKFAARLQAEQGGSSPILLMEQQEGGHGVSGSADQVMTQAVDQYAFLFHYLKVKPQTPK